MKQSLIKILRTVKFNYNKIQISENCEQKLLFSYKKIKDRV